MDTRIIDFHSKSGNVDWTNEASVANYMVEGFAIMSDYYFDSLYYEQYYLKIILSDPREENDTIFYLGTIDVDE